MHLLHIYCIYNSKKKTSEEQPSVVEVNRTKQAVVLINIPLARDHRLHNERNALPCFSPFTGQHISECIDRKTEVCPNISCRQSTVSNVHGKDVTPVDLEQDQPKIFC